VSFYTESNSDGEAQIHKATARLKAVDGGGFRLDTLGHDGWMIGVKTYDDFDKAKAGHAKASKS